jgi:hypothetical protein
MAGKRDKEQPAGQGGDLERLEAARLGARSQTQAPNHTTACAYRKL